MQRNDAYTQSSTFQMPDKAEKALKRSIDLQTLQKTAVEKELLIPRGAIRNRVKELACRISSDHKGREIVLIGILNGVIFFFADLVRELTVPARIDFIRAKSYGSGTISSRDVRFTKDVEIPLHDRSVILVEDIVDTGLTLKRIIDRIENEGPESLRTCALIEKLERREIEVPIDYCGFRVKEGFVVGYGLDYNEKYRNLPDVYVLK
ncbi:MAG: hypoxanthine phosphoribosyltransferase [Desulfatiglandaceae bacterium]